MRLLSIALVLVCASSHMKAQHIKASLTQGIGLYSNSSKDSLFFAKQHYVTQLRVGYHYGKIGVIANVNYIQQQNLKDNSEDSRMSTFLREKTYTFANISTIQAALGIEICVPVIKHKAQLNFYATYGISKSDSKPFSFTDSMDLVYSHKANGKLSGCLQTGFSFNFKINRHLAIKWQNEFVSYKIQYNGLDIRRKPIEYTGVQNKSLVISSFGIQYLF